MNTDPNRNVRAQLRLMWCVLVLALFTAGAPALHIHPLNLLDANDQPEKPVNLSGPKWTGTMDDARLSANVPMISGGQLNLLANLSVNGSTTLDGGNITTSGYGALQVLTLTVDDAISTPTLVGPTLVTDQIFSGGGDPYISLADSSTGELGSDGVPALQWSYGTVTMPGTLSVANSITCLNEGIFDGDVAVGGTLYGDGSGLSNVHFFYMGSQYLYEADSFDANNPRPGSGSGCSLRPTSDYAFSSWDGGTYFDDSGFHGTALAIGATQVIDQSAGGWFSGLFVSGPCALDGGNTSTDGQGNFSVGGGLAVYGDLQFTGQSAVTETVTPDCTLIVYDGNGDVIRLLGQRQ